MPPAGSPRAKATRDNEAKQQVGKPARGPSKGPANEAPAPRTTSKTGNAPAQEPSLGAGVDPARQKEEVLRQALAKRQIYSVAKAEITEQKRKTLQEELLLPPPQEPVVHTQSGPLGKKGRKSALPEQPHPRISLRMVSQAVKKGCKLNEIKYKAVDGLVVIGHRKKLELQLLQIVGDSLSEEAAGTGLDWQELLSHLEGLVQEAKLIRLRHAGEEDLDEFIEEVQVVADAIGRNLQSRSLVQTLWSDLGDLQGRRKMNSVVEAEVLWNKLLGAKDAMHRSEESSRELATVLKKLGTMTSKIRASSKGHTSDHFHPGDAKAEERRIEALLSGLRKSVKLEISDMLDGTEHGEQDAIHRLVELGAEKDDARKMLQAIEDGKFQSFFDNAISGLLASASRTRSELDVLAEEAQQEVEEYFPEFRERMHWNQGKHGADHMSRPSLNSDRWTCKTYTSRPSGLVATEVHIPEPHTAADASPHGQASLGRALRRHGTLKEILEEADGKEAPVAPLAELVAPHPVAAAQPPEGEAAAAEAAEHYSSSDDSADSITEFGHYAKKKGWKRRGSGGRSGAQKLQAEGQEALESLSHLLGDQEDKEHFDRRRTLVFVLQGPAGTQGRRGSGGQVRRGSVTSAQKVDGQEQGALPSVGFEAAKPSELVFAAADSAAQRRQQPRTGGLRAAAALLMRAAKVTGASPNTQEQPSLLMTSAPAGAQRQIKGGASGAPRARMMRAATKATLEKTLEAQEEMLPQLPSAKAQSSGVRPGKVRGKVPTARAQPQKGSEFGLSPEAAQGAQAARDSRASEARRGTQSQGTGDLDVAETGTSGPEAGAENSQGDSDDPSDTPPRMARKARTAKKTMMVRKTHAKAHFMAQEGQLGSAYVVVPAAGGRGEESRPLLPHLVAKERAADGMAVSEDAGDAPSQQPLGFLAFDLAKSISSLIEVEGGEEAEDEEEDEEEGDLDEAAEEAGLAGAASDEAGRAAVASGGVAPGADGAAGSGAGGAEGAEAAASVGADEGAGEGTAEGAGDGAGAAFDAGLAPRRYSRDFKAEAVLRKSLSQYGGVQSLAMFSDDVEEDGDPDDGAPGSDLDADGLEGASAGGNPDGVTGVHMHGCVGFVTFDSEEAAQAALEGGLPGLSEAGLVAAVLPADSLERVTEEGEVQVQKGGSDSNSSGFSDSDSSSEAGLGEEHGDEGRQASRVLRQIQGDLEPALEELKKKVVARFGSVEAAVEDLGAGADGAEPEAEGAGRVSVAALHAALAEAGYARSRPEVVVLLRALGLYNCDDSSVLSTEEFLRLAEPSRWLVPATSTVASKFEALLGALRLRRILMESLDGPQLLLAQVHTYLAAATHGSAEDTDFASLHLLAALRRCNVALRKQGSEEFAKALISSAGLRVLTKAVGSPKLEVSTRKVAAGVLSRALEAHGGPSFSAQRAEEALASSPGKFSDAAGAAQAEDGTGDDGSFGASEPSAGPRLRGAGAAREAAESQAKLEAHLASELWWPLLVSFDPDPGAEKLPPPVDGQLLRQILALFLQAHLPQAVAGVRDRKLAPQVITALSWLHEGRAQAIQYLEYLELLERSFPDEGVAALAAALGGCRLLWEQLIHLLRKGRAGSELRRRGKHLLKEWYKARERLLARHRQSHRKHSRDFARLHALARVVAQAESEGFETVWPPLAPPRSGATSRAQRKSQLSVQGQQPPTSPEAASTPGRRGEGTDADEASVFEEPARESLGIEHLVMDRLRRRQELTPKKVPKLEMVMPSPGRLGPGSARLPGVDRLPALPVLSQSARGHNPGDRPRVPLVMVEEHIPFTRFWKASPATAVGQAKGGALPQISKMRPMGGALTTGGALPERAWAYGGRG